MIAEKLGAILIEEGRGTDADASAGLEKPCAAAQRLPRTREDIASAACPIICSGCPHNSSTKVPEGSRAYAGIGCHFMVHLDGPRDERFHPYGRRGGELDRAKRRFRTTDPMCFRTLATATYNHSGLMAVRAALAAGVNITYKILYNDAVAMTGGQANDGRLATGEASRAELLADGRGQGASRLSLIRKRNLRRCRSFPKERQLARPVRDDLPLRAGRRMAADGQRRDRDPLYPDLRR